MNDWMDDLVFGAAKTLKAQGFTVEFPGPYDDAVFVVSRVDHSFFVYVDHSKVGEIQVLQLAGDFQRIIESNDGPEHLGEVTIKRPPNLSTSEFVSFVKQIVSAFETF